MHVLSNRSFSLRRYVLLAAISALLRFGFNSHIHAQTKSSEPDVLVLSNGDTLHGKLISEIAGKVKFHTDALGDLTLGWDKIKELHTTQKFGVLEKQSKAPSSKPGEELPTGTLTVENHTVTVQPENAPALPPIADNNAQYIMDAATLDKQLNHEPGFFTAWSGAATAGATLVAATQKQYTFSGGVALQRSVPTVDWLRPRNRTSIGFTGSFGKIVQPSYTDPGPPAVLVPSVTTKSAIYHAEAERDQYFSPRFFVLAQTAFDHNYSQDLDLQQIYGGGIGWTLIKNPRQQLDLKASAQYEKQQFISGSSSNMNLFGSTYSANYVLHSKLFGYTQGLSYIPAYTNLSSYSVNETNSFTFPAYKNLGFTVGTMDSYLNNPPASLPPTQRNSFQFTMGFTYAIKSNY
jgi:hypothetical protein